MSLAPFVPTPQEVVEKMLELAEVKPGEILYDLGCGDARIVMTAAQKYGAKAFGVELDDGRYLDCVKRVKEVGLDGLVKIIHSNVLEISLKEADVVTLYLLTSANEKLRPNLERDLKSGARVVSHDFSMPGWTAVRTEEIIGNWEPWYSHTIYVYKR